MPEHVLCYLRQNEQNDHEQNEKVVNHLAITKGLTKNRVPPRQILIIPAILREENLWSVFIPFSSPFSNNSNHSHSAYSYSTRD